MVADGQGGALVAWEFDAYGSPNILMSYVNALGSKVWEATTGVGFVEVCSATNSQNTPTIVLDGSGGAIVAWDDSRTGIARDIYAQRIEPRNGAWGRPEPKIDLVSDVPGDQGGHVAVDWVGSQRDFVDHTIEHYSLWRATRSTNGTLARAMSAPQPKETLPPHAEGLVAAAEWLEQSTSADYFWEWIASQDAMYFSAYSYMAPTRNDSTALDPATHHFLVVAHTAEPTVFWTSDPESAYSVDNLAPAAPNRVDAMRLQDERVRVSWAPASESDLRDFAVYRSQTPNVIPDPEHFLAAVAETSYVDESAEHNVAYYYIVTASDVHGNEGAPSNEVSVAGSTSAQEQLRLAGLALLPNSPNPFRSTTTIRFGLARAARIELSLYDVGGRMIWRRELGEHPAGWHSFGLDRSTLGGEIGFQSGVYFLHAKAAGIERSQRLVVQR
jgi:hypothetical protein